MNDTITTNDANHIELIMRKWIESLSNINHEACLDNNEKDLKFNRSVVIYRDVLNRTISIMTAGANMISTLSSKIEFSDSGIAADSVDNAITKNKQEPHGLG